MPKQLTSQPYLKELKELDPIRLKHIREKALETRRAKSEKIANFKDISEFPHKKLHSINFPQNSKSYFKILQTFIVFNYERV